MPPGGYQVPIEATNPNYNRHVSPWEVATMMRRAGFPNSELAQGVAIVGAESGFRVDAENTSSSVHHIGLFQIASDKGYDNDKLKHDAQYNVNAAYLVWKSQGWARGWLNYENGSSRKFTNIATSAVAQSKKNVPDNKLRGWNVHKDDISAVHEAVGVVPGGSDVYEGVQTAGSAVGDFLGLLGELDTWIRAGEIVGGAVMFMVGTVLLARVAT